MDIVINGYRVLNEAPAKPYAGGPWYDKGLCNICKGKLKKITTTPTSIQLGIKLCQKDTAHLPTAKKDLQSTVPVKISTLKTKSNVSGLSSWLSKTLTVQGNGKDKSKVEAALLDLKVYNTRLHWALIEKQLKLESKRITGSVKIVVKVVKRQTNEETYCQAHYDPTGGELDVTICDDYMVDSPVGILGAIHFEAHNARNGARFRKRNAWRNIKKPADWIPAVEYAGWTCTIELDTFFGWARDAAFICMHNGFIGVQEWRNLMSIGGSEFGCKDLKWIKTNYDYTADALYAFSFSSHNPNLTDLNETSFAGYLPGRVKQITYDTFLRDFLTFQHSWTYKKVAAFQRNALKSWLKKDNLKGWVEPDKADQLNKDPNLGLLTYCRVIAGILGAKGNASANIEEIKRYRVPDVLFDLCIKGNTRTFVQKVGGRELTRVRALSTLSKEEFKATYTLSDLD